MSDNTEFFTICFAIMITLISIVFIMSYTVITIANLIW